MPLPADAAEEARRTFEALDKDRDGKLQGGEAAQVLARSGLDRTTLRSIWELAVGSAGELNVQQFIACQALVRHVMSGQPLPAAMPPMQAQQPAPMPGGVMPLPADAAEEARRTFAALDRDGDGMLQGGEAAGVLAQSGLDRATLKSIWSLAVGDAGALDVQQFIACQALVRHAMSGRPLPSPGGMPPPQQQQQQQQAMPPPAMMPPLPLAVPMPQHMAPMAQPAFQYTHPRVPAAPPMTMTQDEQRRLGDLQTQVRESDEAVQRMQAEAAAAKKQVEMFRTAMQELVMFRSRMEAERLQVDAQLRAASNEKDAFQKQYEEKFASHATFREQLDAQRQRLTSAHEEKAKLGEAIAGMTEASHEQEAAASAEELAAVESEIAGLKEHLSMVRQEQMARRQQSQSAIAKATLERENLKREIESYRLETEAAKADAERHEASLREVRDQAAEVLSKEGMDKEGIERLLHQSGKIWAALQAAALKCGVEVPSTLVPPMKLEWSETLANHAAEWEDALGDSDGFVTVENLEQLAASGPVSNESQFQQGMPIRFSFDQAALHTKQEEGGDAKAAE